MSGWAVVVIAALAAVLPLLVHRAPSCGHDFDFHLQSWLAVADSWHHGLLAPHWVPGANYNAGEPRFVFYPPLSWLLGAFLAILLPWSAVPLAFTGVCAAGAAWAMHSVANRYCAPPAAALASGLYALSPYLLFTGYERTAYGELLAAVWVPLLLGALLRGRFLPTAVLLALLWYTNAPAGVMGCYLVLLALCWRLVFDSRRGAALLRHFGALLLGCFLAADYLLPAWYGQRFVTIQAAVGEDMRVEDSFLFAHTGGVFHQAVLHTASWIGVWTLGLGLAAGVGLLWRERAFFEHKREKDSANSTNLDKGHPERSEGPAFFSTPGASRSFVAPAPQDDSWAAAGFLVLLLLDVLLLQLRPSAPIWHLLPQLGFLQFPWRLLLPAGAAAALLLGRIAPRGVGVYAAALLLAAGLSGWAGMTRFQPCDEEDNPRAQLALPGGFPGTDEYAAKNSDNGEIQTGLPPVRLLASADADLGDDSTRPNPNWRPGPGVPGAVTIADWSAEHKLVRVIPEKASYAVLRLERNPAWRVTVDGQPCGRRCVAREDGLIAVEVQRPSTLEIQWSTTSDVWWGRVLSGCGVFFLVGCLRRYKLIHSYASSYDEPT